MEAFSSLWIKGNKPFPDYILDLFVVFMGKYRSIGKTKKRVRSVTHRAVGQGVYGHRFELL